MAACSDRMQDMNDTITTATTSFAPSGPNTDSNSVSTGVVFLPAITAAMSGCARMSARQTNAAAAMPI